MRTGSESGSVTLLGTWVLGSFLAIAVLVFLLSQRECQLVMLTEKNLPLQLLAEDVLEEHRIMLQQDIGRADELLGMEEWRIVELSAGERDSMRYRVTGKNSDGKIILVVYAEYRETMMLGNVYMLQWCLEADREQGKVILERIG